MWLLPSADIFYPREDHSHTTGNEMRFRGRDAAPVYGRLHRPRESHQCNGGLLTGFLNVVLKASFKRLITNNISVVASDNAMYSANVEFLVTVFFLCFLINYIFKHSNNKSSG